MNAYRKILVAVDGSAAANKGLREAIRLAKSENARLFILHVVDEFAALTPLDGMATAGVDVLPMLKEGGEKVLAKAKALAMKSELKPQTLLREMLSGPAAGPIVREAKKLGADLIVLGTHGRRGVRRIVLGSDAEQVVRLATVPVLLVR